MTPPSVRNQDEEVAEAARTDASIFSPSSWRPYARSTKVMAATTTVFLYDGDHLFDLAVTPYTGSAPPLMAVKGLSRRSLASSNFISVPIR